MIKYQLFKAVHIYSKIMLQRLYKKSDAASDYDTKHKAFINVTIPGRRLYIVNFKTDTDAAIT